MSTLLLFLFLLSQFLFSYSQPDPIVHHSIVKKGRIAMSSNPYKPNSWEKPYYDSSLKSGFPSDLIRCPDKFLNRLIHLIGIVDSVYVDSSNNVTFLLKNKYWDYIEDYSIQDEKMFVSEKGDGKFLVSVSNVSDNELEDFKKYPDEHKLFLVYGTFLGKKNDLPILLARKIKYIDYEFYTTKVFSYELERDKNGDLVTDKKGRVITTNFTFLKVAGAGQNK